MNPQRSCLLSLVIVAGLASTEILAQDVHVVPEGNSAFSSVKARFPQRQLHPRTEEGEFPTEDALLRSLYADLKELSRYAISGERISVTRLSHSELEAMVCTSPCNVLGFYRDGQIFIDQRLQPESNIYDRSVLFHELMHYLQDLNSAYGAEATCDRWYLREIEAYSAQQQYLSASGSSVHLASIGLWSMCRESGARQAKLDQR